MKPASSPFLLPGTHRSRWMRLKRRKPDKGASNTITRFCRPARLRGKRSGTKYNKTDSKASAGNLARQRGSEAWGSREREWVRATGTDKRSGVLITLAHRGT